MSVCRWARGRWTSCVCVWPLWTLRWSRRSRRSGSVTRPRGSPSWTPSRPKNDGSRTSERKLPSSSQQQLQVRSLKRISQLLTDTRRQNCNDLHWCQTAEEEQRAHLCPDINIVSVWFNTMFPLFCLLETIWVFKICFGFLVFNGFRKWESLMSHHQQLIGRLTFLPFISQMSLSLVLCGTKSF